MGRTGDKPTAGWIGDVLLTVAGDVGIAGGGGSFSIAGALRGVARSVSSTGGWTDSFRRGWIALLHHHWRGGHCLGRVLLGWLWVEFVVRVASLVIVGVLLVVAHPRPVRVIDHLPAAPRVRAIEDNDMAVSLTVT